MLQVSQEKDVYFSDFERLTKDEAGQCPTWVYALRQAAMDHFSELNFPTLREEEWRFTNVAPMVKMPFRPVVQYARRGLTAAQIEPFALSGLRGHRLVFIDGLYSRELSTVAQTAGRLRVTSLAEALRTEADLVKSHLAQHARYDDNAFTALNTAFIRDGAFVYVPDGVVLEEPVHLLFISTAPGDATVSYLRNLIVLGRSSRAAVIESYAGWSGSPSLSNVVTEIVVGAGAALDHYKIQREGKQAFHLATAQVHQERDSLFSAFSLDLGSALARTDLRVRLAAEGGECALNGLYLLDGRQHVDNHTAIDHARPHGTSNELYKGILAGKSKAVFNGKIVVRKEAQQTDAHQTNKNLLLSDEAQVNTTPQLEILADDVKCTHGATVGQLEESAVFYLKSRGIGDETARRLLTYGFASDVINRIKPEPIRTPLSALVLAKLERPLAKESL